MSVSESGYSHSPRPSPEKLTTGKTTIQRIVRTSQSPLSLKVSPPLPPSPHHREIRYQKFGMVIGILGNGTKQEQKHNRSPKNIHRKDLYSFSSFILFPRCQSFCQSYHFIQVAHEQYTKTSYILYFLQLKRAQVFFMLPISNKFERHIGLSLPSVCQSVCPSIRLSVLNAYRQLGNSRTALLGSLNFLRGMYMKKFRRPVIFFLRRSCHSEVMPFSRLFHFIQQRPCVVDLINF